MIDNVAFNFSDIFRKSFLSGWANQTISISTVITTLLITSVLAFYIFFAYRILTRKTFYSKSFNISLGGVALITAAIIITIQSSIVISLGMVGALSIVRFRTAIKNPLDLMFLFWSISIGIICGAGYSIYAVFLSLVLTIFILILNCLPDARAPKILVVNSKDVNVEKEILSLIKEFSKRSTVKACNMSKTGMDLTIEIGLNTECSALLNQLLMKDYITHASVLAHDGEVVF